MREGGVEKAETEKSGHAAPMRQTREEKEGACGQAQGFIDRTDITGHPMQ